MVVDTLTLEENAYSGFSHEVNITFADLAALPSGLTGTLTVTGLANTQDILIRAAVVVDASFTGTGITALTMSAADSASNTVFAAQNILAAPGAPAVFALTIGYAAAANLIFTFTATGANVNLASTGQVRVLLSKTSLAKFAKY